MKPFRSGTKLIVVTAAMLLLSCFESQQPTNPGTPEEITQKSKDMGLEGGNISFAEPESPLYGASIDIPEGALESAATVSVGVSSERKFALDSTIQVVSIKPDIHFQKPVMLTLPVSESIQPGDSVLAYFWSEDDSSWMPADSVVCDSVLPNGTRVLTVSTWHFSDWSVFHSPDFTFGCSLYPNKKGKWAAKVDFQGSFLDYWVWEWHLGVAGYGWRLAGYLKANKFPSSSLIYDVTLRKCGMLGTRTKLGTSKFRWVINSKAPTGGEFASSFDFELQTGDGNAVIKRTGMPYDSVEFYFKNIPAVAHFANATCDEAGTYDILVKLGVDYGERDSYNPVSWTSRRISGTEWKTITNINSVLFTDYNTDGIVDAYDPPPSDNALLSSMTISEGALSPSFAHETYAYSATVANNVESVTLSIRADDENARVLIGNGTPISRSDSRIIELSTGQNEIPVTVVAENNTTANEYTLIILREEPKPVLAVPEIHSVEATANTITIEISEITGASTYRVYYAEGTSVSSQSPNVITVENPTSANGLITVEIPTVNPEKEYSFIVVVSDESGEYVSNANESQSISTPAKKSVILNSPTSVSARSITFTWSVSNLSTIDHFNVYYSTAKDFSTSNAQKTKVGDPTATEWALTHLEHSQEYFLKVEAVLGTGESVLSNEVSATTELVPTDVIIEKMGFGVTHISIRWTKSGAKDFSKYKVFASTSNQIDPTSTPARSFASWPGKGCIISGLQPATTYYVQVYVAHGSKFDGSNVLTVTTNPALAQMRDYRDGKLYDITQVGDQVWMAENLNFEPSSANTDCPYDNCDEYGRLYEWEAAVSDDNVNGSDICPCGWHVPSDEEWKELERSIGIPENEIELEGLHIRRGEKQIFKILDFETWGETPQYYLVTNDYDLSFKSKAQMYWTSTPDQYNKRAYTRTFQSGEIGRGLSSTQSNSGAAIVKSVRCVKDGNELVPASITEEPEGKKVAVGEDVTFTVSASGTTPLSYQWFRNGRVITDAATASTYTIENVTIDDDLTKYSVEVSNCAGRSTSEFASLDVVGLPAITTQPVSRTVALGDATEFTVGATGEELVFQWKKNGSDIPGADSSTYSIAATTSTANKDVYVCIVSNIAGSITSNEATLLVITPPAALNHKMFLFWREVRLNSV